jgi:hypothetical protein
LPGAGFPAKLDYSRLEDGPLGEKLVFLCAFGFAWKPLVSFLATQQHKA